MTTKDTEETIKLGQNLGSQLRGGEVIRLIGDVGAGKTTLVRGLAAGVGSSERVSSPTFTVHKLYKGRIKLYHYDFYRVQDDSAVASELEELMEDRDTSVVIEWPEYARLKLSTEPLDITITTLGDHVRRLKINVPDREGSYIKLP
jgi:tRNA threonylcarbamoyladenosine biosynthesis protein TsaE